MSPQEPIIQLMFQFKALLKYVLVTWGKAFNDINFTFRMP